MFERIMSFLLIGVLLLSLGTCSFSLYKEEYDYQKNKPNYPIIPKEFSDCKLGEIQTDRNRIISVMRCPNSTTTIKYPVGKYTQETVTRDGN